MWNIWLRAFHTFLWTSVLALCSLPMYGQTADTGAIAGPVSDPSGALGRACGNSRQESGHTRIARSCHGCVGWRKGSQYAEAG